MAAFSDEEFRDRLARTQRLMGTHQIDCIVCLSPELLYYFSGYDGHTHFSDQALVLGREDPEPTLIHRDVDTGLAERSCWHHDLRTYHHGETHAYDLILRAIQERTSNRSSVGVEFDCHALRGAKALTLQQKLEPWATTDFSSELNAIRLPKSDTEINYLRTAGQFANAGLARALEMAKPGMSEIELAGHLELAMSEQGSEYPAMPAWVSSGPNTVGAHKTPTARKLKNGDRLKLEFAGVSHRYHAVTMQTFWLHQAPSRAVADIYNVAANALRQGEAAIAVGTPVAESEKAAFEVLEDHGFDLRWHSRFGYGVGIAYPPTWLEPLDITRESSQIFEQDQSFTLHIAVKDPVQGLGLMLGGAYLLTTQGLEVLSGGALELTTT